MPRIQIFLTRMKCVLMRGDVIERWKMQGGADGTALERLAGEIDEIY